MIKNYFRIAWRIIARNRLYTLINILSLALGICGCIVIWLVTSYELSFDRFHPDGDRIYRVGIVSNLSGMKGSEVLPPMPEAIRQTIPGLEGVTAFFGLRSSVTIPASGAKPAVEFDGLAEGHGRLSCTIIADGNWFTIFKYQWLAGNPSVALSRPFSVVLTEARARLYFGPLSPEAFIGKEVIYQDSLHVHVTGIVKGWKENTDLPYSDFISFPTIAVSFLKNVRHMDDWVPHQGMGQWYWPTCWVRLPKGVRPEQVDAEMIRIDKQNIGTNKEHRLRLQLQPLADVHFNNDYSDDNIRKAHLPTIYALMGIALFILILGIVNFVNLSTAQSIQRAREIGVRKVLGSGRTSLVAQFLTETGIITGLAVFLAALLVKPAMGFFREYIPESVHFMLLKPGNLLFLAVIAIGTTLLAGFYPARVMAGYLPVISLKGGGVQKGGERWWLRKSLIVFQFTISLVFIIVALLMGNQIRYMLNTDYGFKTDAIVTVATDWRDTTGRVKVLEQRFKQLPGIAAIVREGNPPIGWGGWMMNIQYKGKRNINQTAVMDFGDEKFIPFYKMQMVAGRNIRTGDSLAEWVINETMARSLGFGRPEETIGQLLYFNDFLSKAYGMRGYPIVGVVADYHVGSFKEPIQPVAIGHNPRAETSLGIRLASAGKSAGEVNATLAAMGKIYNELYPKDPWYYLFLDESIANLYDTEQKTASLARSVMILAIFISCMGLFGLALFTARRKAAEISIRKVLGATTADIAALLNKGFIVLVMLALVIASPLAWWLTNRWLRDFAYRAPVAWWVFPVAGAGAIVIALLTVSFQSFRAAMANPIKNLRTE